MNSLIPVFRVYVSGEASTFDNADTALGYLRSQAIHNKIEKISFESTVLNLTDYQEEVAKQEENN